MSNIVSINTEVAGQTGINPRRVTIISKDNLATVTAAGYLNTKNLLGNAIYSTDEIVMWYSYVSPASPGIFAIFTASIASGGVITLTQWANPGEVVTPTIASHIAVFTDTLGTIGDDAATAINGGNIQAGLSGTAGTLASFPATASRGSLKIVGVANLGNTDVTISNAAMGQASVVSIPDPGAATADVILSKSAGTQAITVGNFSVSAGTISASGNITSAAGSVISGASTGGVVGKVQLFPTTATRGSLTVQAVANTGDTATILQTASLGQATTYTVPDPVAATAAVVVAPSALVSGNLIKASGTAGLVVDQGVAFKSVAGAAAAGGNAAQSFTDAFCTSGSCVVGNWNTQANVASVLKIVPGNGSFVVTSSADAGVGTFNYIITK